MKPRSNWVVPLTAVGLGLALSGCGGSSNESEPVVNLNDPAYQGPQLASQAPAPAPEPAAEPEPAEAAEPAAPFEAARPELTKREPATGAGPDEPSESEPGEQQPTELAMLNDSGPSRNNETSAMNEMLSAGASAAPSRKEETKTQGAQAPGGPAEYESGGMDEYGGGEEMGYEEMGYEEGYPEGYPGMEGDGFEGDFGGGPGLDFGGGGGAGADKAADFSSPFKAADSFLDAVKSRNIQRLAEATALRAPLEADPKNRDLFQAILESSLSPDEVDKIASQLEGYKISGNNQPKSTGSFGVIVSKQDSESNATLSRTIELRKEKAGWKVKDISGVRRLDQPRGMGRGRRR